MAIIHSKIKQNEAILIFWITLFFFQNLLDDYVGVFSYVDELPALFGIVYIFLNIRTHFSKRIDTKWYRSVFVFISLFLLAGIIGNIRYHYQNSSLVMIDILTNVKFPLTILFFEYVSSEKTNEYKIIPRYVRFLSYMLMGLFFLDMIFKLYPSGYRHGLRSVQLFFDHPTYLAGICIFLLGFLSLYYTKKNNLAIICNLMLLIFTFRFKAIAAAACFIIMFLLIVVYKVKLKLWQIVLLAGVSVFIAWSQIYFYYFQLSGSSARSVILLTSLKIMQDYFPFGTGFGTYASHSAAINYSPVYVKYGFNMFYELRNSSKGTFFDDQFWPIIFGQTGVLGTLFYFGFLFVLVKRIQSIKRINATLFFVAIYLLVYLFISSVAEPAFNNSISIPLAMIIGIVFKIKNKENSLQ